jgi:hypothetical protein
VSPLKGLDHKIEAYPALEALGYLVPVPLRGTRLLPVQLALIGGQRSRNYTSVRLTKLLPPSKNREGPASSRAFIANYLSASDTSH